MTSDELFERYRRDRSPRDFEAVVEAYRPLVHSVCRRYLRDPADVEDAVQETFLRLATNVDAIHSSVPAWLAATAYTTSNLLIRRALRERRRRVALAREPARSGGHLLHDAIQRVLHPALVALDERSRALITERFFRRTPLRLLADARRESIATASRRVTAALSELVEILRGMGLESVDEQWLARYFAPPGAGGEPPAGVDPMRFASDWRVPELSPPLGAGATPVPEPTLPGWRRPIRVGVLVGHVSSITLSGTEPLSGERYLHIEVQAFTTQLMRARGLRLVGIVEPGTAELGPVERTLREYELTAGLIDATDVAALRTLDVILLGMNFRMARGVAPAIHRAVAAGVGLLNEWWTDLWAGHDPDLCALMLADPPLYAYHTPGLCGPPLTATVLEEHHLLPGLTRGQRLSVVGCGPVYRVVDGARVLVAKDLLVSEHEHRIPSLGPARMPVCVAGQLGRGRVFVTNVLRQAEFAANLLAPAEDYLTRVLMWLAEPRREEP